MDGLPVVRKESDGETGEFTNWGKEMVKSPSELRMY